MKKNEIKDIIGSLSRQEFNRFINYIHSPFFRVSERIKRLAEILDSAYEQIIAGGLTREEIAAEALSASHSPESARKLFSDLNREVENFLEMVEFESSPEWRSHALLRRLRKSGSHNFPRKINEYTSALKKLPPEADTYLAAMHLHEEELAAEPETAFHKYSPALQAASDMLDAYYFSRKLFLFELMSSKQQLIGKQEVYNMNMYTETENYITSNEANIKDRFPDIYAMHLMLKMLSTKDNSLTGDYSDHIEKNKNKLSPGQQMDFYSDVYNYLSIRISEGERGLRQTLFELCKMLDDKDFLCTLERGMIHPYSFKQISDTAIYLKELEWAEYFINKYSVKMDAPEAKNILNLAFAKLHYYKNELPQSRIRLAKVDYDDYINYLDAKKFLVCLEYDDGNYNEVMLVVDSLHKYLKSHPHIPRLFSENTDNFLKYIKALISLKENVFDEFAIKKLGVSLASEKSPVYAAAWLEDKLQEFEKKT